MRHLETRMASVGMPTCGMTTGSDLIASALELEGVDTVFTLAGDHILPTLDCMSDRGFRFIDTRHEQAAAHMADAWGRITGRPGVAMYTTPGFANAMPGLANAMHSGSPLLSISGSAELHELGRGAMQEIDQVGMARPVTKSAWMVTDARRIPDMIATALRVAYEGRRGPVHLTIPVDIQQQVVGKAEVSLFNPGEYRDQAAPSASHEKVRDAVAILREAERPLVIVGSAGAYSGSGEALQEARGDGSAAFYDRGRRERTGTGYAPVLLRLFRLWTEPRRAASQRGRRGRVDGTQAGPDRRVCPASDDLSRRAGDTDRPVRR